MKVMNQELRHCWCWLVGALYLFTSSAWAGQCTYTIETEWDRGFVASLSIENDTDDVIDGWALDLTFRSNNRIQHSWSGIFTGTDAYNIQAYDWNKRIAPGQTIQLGFVGSKNGHPVEQNPILTGSVCHDGVVRVDNPFRDVSFYVNPDWAANAVSEPGGEYVADQNTAVWMDRIDAITAGRGLRGHLDEALAQGAGMFLVVIYNLPGRDCAAGASVGELTLSEKGFARYKDEFIAPIIDIMADPKYRSINIAAVVEVDSLPNLVTNLSVPTCAEANGPGGYRDAIRHTLNQLATVPNAYAYLDIAHSAWLGWDENFNGAIELYDDVISSTDKGWDSVAGFASNTSNFIPAVEPFLPDPNLNLGGLPIRSSSYFQWNTHLEEKSFVQAWREAMISRGAPATIGMLIDTGRNGWGGPDRPTTVSTSDDIDTYVNASRIDRRGHRGNWCNQASGLGYKPWADPFIGIDAFVWVKPPGESDGVSDVNFAIDPNNPEKGFDPMCDPNGMSVFDPAVGTGALPNAPHAGSWFPSQFRALLENAYPPIDRPAGPPMP